MKKTLLAAALTGMFSITAQAQSSGSSVTLYGLIDAGLAYETAQFENGKATWKQSSGMISGNRWGLRGQENLGGGTRAIFTLENGFDINNGRLGQDNRMFGRQAFGGLSNNQLGTLTLGRQYDSLVDHLAPLSMAGTHYGGNMAQHPYDNDNLGGSIRISNSIKYQSPNYNGFQFGGLYGFSNKAGDFSNNRAYSLGLSYANGPLTLAAGLLQIHGAKNAGALNTEGAADSLVNFNSTMPFNGNDVIFAGNTEQKRIFGLGGTYAFGPAKIGLLWTQSRDVIGGTINDGINNFDGKITTQLNNIELNGRYMLTPAVSLSGGYTYSFGTTSTSMPDVEKAKLKSHTFTLQATYALSKRTDVYLAGTYRKNSNGKNNIESFKQAIIADQQVTPKSSQTVIATGLRHRF